MNNVLFLCPLLCDRKENKFDTLEWPCSYIYIYIPLGYSYIILLSIELPLTYTMHNICLIPTHFTSLPNEIVLIFWKYLTNVEAIKSFGSMKCQRYSRLLEAYCYKSIDFYATTLSTFRLCCTSILNKFRLNVQILKLGHRDSYSQLRIFSQYCLGE